MLIFLSQPKREVVRRMLPINLSSSQNSGNSTTSESSFRNEATLPKQNLESIISTVIQKENKSAFFSGLDWDITCEYNPLHPTDYDKITRGQ